MKWLQHLLVLAVFLLTTEAVKEYLFKNCDNSGFCERNRFYAKHISSLGSSSSPYVIDPESIVTDSTAIRGVIKKSIVSGSKIELPFEVSILDGDSLRFRIDEDRSHVQIAGKDSNRYNQTADYTFLKPPKQLTKSISKDKITKDSETLSYFFGPQSAYSLELQYNPVKLVVSKNGQQQVVVNGRNFLNVEHFRTKDENYLHLDPAVESEFDMFSSSFADSAGDSIPFGPESVAVDVELKEYTHAYGIPEHADSLNLKDTTGSKWPYRLFNIDIFEYETDSRMPMYGAIPLLFGARPESSVGIFWVNSADTFVDIEKSTSINSHWISESGVLDVVVILGDKPQDINSKYGLITGFMPLPQEFALGYHQCRWNYNDEQDVLDVSSKMDEHLIPYDTIWLDIEYTDEKKYFTWDKNTFPHHVEMMQKLDSTGRNLVVIIDPHLKVGYYVSDEVIESGLEIKTPSNATYKGHCWPGESVWIDAMNPSAQAYWDTLFSYSEDSFLAKQDNVHLWNDMNEPSVFNGPETSSPRDNLHYGDVEHRSLHNLWGMKFHELTYESLIKRLQNTSRQRPFVLTRSFFAGSQRTAAMWTGDNMAKWEYLKASIPMILTSNMVNMPFAGADVGGFFGDPSSELLTRWYQAGIWYPFFRAHAHIDSKRREPWIPGEPYTSLIRDAVRLRYSLLPTFYTVFHKSSLDGSPIWKPMFYESPDDTSTYEIEDQFYLGDTGILVKPVTDENCREIQVYIPQGEVFYDYTNGVLQGSLKNSGYVTKKVDLKDIPVFLRGGAIFARKTRYRRSSKLMRNDPYSLVVALNSTKEAYGSLYIDDGESFGYKDGKFVLASFVAVGGRKISGSSVSGDEDFAESVRGKFIETITIAYEDLLPVAKMTVSQKGKTSNADFSQDGNSIVISGLKINPIDEWTVELIPHSTAEHDEL